MNRPARLTDDYAPTEPNGDVIFSFVDGFVWASWPGGVSMVRVGRYETVIASMQDFLAQCELGERLANGRASMSDQPCGRSSL
jgi:hypothetical protein